MSLCIKFTNRLVIRYQWRRLWCQYNNSGVHLSAAARSVHQLSQFKTPATAAAAAICCRRHHWRTTRQPSLVVMKTFNRSVKTGQPDDGKRNLFSWKSFLISGGLFAVFMAAFLQFKQEKMQKLEKDRKRSLGRASIGGQFELIDQNGRPFQSKDLLGKWYLLYFGFTHCPDVCPDEIEKMVEAVKKVRQMSGMDDIRMVFITVDPERDTPEAVKGYLKEFSDEIIGLTGSKDQIEAATRAYRVYYSAGPRDHEDDYIVDHTIIMYLVNPKGEFVDYYGQTKTADDVCTGLALNQLKYRKANKKFGIF
ncbi:protein SCO1 homolog, mitochondrial-like [Oppia nitens]|uniref:protein SCO1 homolog, mitochondrial-like n=1 Tax=Oppia nitens TaxID=1686743 RepID=UPI0023DA78B7|nr:protein SCO1 homolog, mitochondrial-like [Oppia nitens]